MKKKLIWYPDFENFLFLQKIFKPILLDSVKKKHEGSIFAIQFYTPIYNHVIINQKITLIIY